MHAFFHSASVCGGRSVSTGFVRNGLTDRTNVAQALQYADEVSQSVNKRKTTGRMSHHFLSERWSYSKLCAWRLALVCRRTSWAIESVHSAGEAKSHRISAALFNVLIYSVHEIMTDIWCIWWPIYNFAILHIYYKAATTTEQHFFIIDWSIEYVFDESIKHVASKMSQNDEKWPSEFNKNPKVVFSSSFNRRCNTTRCLLQRLGWFLTSKYSSSTNLFTVHSCVHRIWELVCLVYAGYETC